MRNNIFRNHIELEKEKRQVNFLHVTFLLVCALLFVNTLCVKAQNIKVSGYVSDKQTHETLPGANLVELVTGTGTSTNQYGFFSISLPPKTLFLTSSYVGYQPKTIVISGKCDTIISFELDVITLKGVEIIAPSAKPVSQDIGRVNIPIARIKEMPALMGEVDIFKSIALSAGISNGSEGSSGLYVRGGSPDQNLILLDGATVYNTTHLFGFLSVFNPDAIKSVEVIKGGFPAKYGGRLSSVIDVTMKDGNNQNRETYFSISPISAHFTIEGPILKGKSSYIFSGRSSYLGLLALPTRFAFESHKTQNYINYFMYDINMKYNYSPNHKSRLFLSLYLGSDKFQNRQHEDNRILNYPLTWGNQTSSFRYTNVLNTSLFSQTHLNYNYYKFGFSFFEESDTPDKKIADPISINLQTSVREFSLKQQFDWSFNSKHKVNVGFEAVQQLFKPDKVTVKNIPELSVSTLSDKNNKISSNSLAIFLSDMYHLSKYIDVEAGMRLSMYFITSSIFIFEEPRLSIILNHNKNSAFKMSFSLMSQPVHLLSGGNQGLPNDVWLPSTSKLVPEKAGQFSLGHNLNLENGIQITNEIFYKKIENCIDYAEGSDFLATISKSWEQNIVSGGEGKVYGYELSTSKATGKLNVQFAYTLMWNSRRFANINNENWYPYKYDRRHDFSLTAGFKITKNWKLTTNWVYMTGQAVTLPTAWIEDISGEFTPVYTGRNMQRMPAYHRLDFAFLKNYITRKGHNASVAVGVYNAYARRNPFAIEVFKFPVTSGSGSSILNGFETKIEQYSLIGFMPYFSFSLKIKQNEKE